MGEAQDARDSDARNSEEGESDVRAEKKFSRYKTLYDSGLVQEQPYYYRGMSFQDFLTEQEYLNKNIRSFQNGSYVPLWKQTWFR